MALWNISYSFLESAQYIHSLIYWIKFGLRVLLKWSFSWQSRWFNATIWSWADFPRLWAMTKWDYMSLLSPQALCFCILMQITKLNLLCAGACIWALWHSHIYRFTFASENSDIKWIQHSSQCLPKIMMKKWSCTQTPQEWQIKRRPWILWTPNAFSHPSKLKCIIFWPTCLNTPALPSCQLQPPSQWLYSSKYTAVVTPLRLLPV